MLGLLQPTTKMPTEDAETVSAAIWTGAGWIWGALRTVVTPPGGTAVCVQGRTTCHFLHSM